MMGYLLSKTKKTGEEKLLPLENKTIFKTGDLLLVCSTHFEICLNSELWSHVALVIRLPDQRLSYAYHAGVFEPLDVYISRFAEIEVRMLECVRSNSFNQEIYTMAQENADMMLSKMDIDIDEREGYAMAMLLQKMGLLHSESVEGAMPFHFSDGASIVERYSKHSQVRV